MANDIIIPKNFGAIPSVFTPAMLDEADEFAAGIAGGFSVLGFRGKVWRTKYRGEEIPHVNDDGTPRGAVDLVLVRSAPNKSKIYYEGGYEEGSNASPTCYSSNGIMPDPSAPVPQCATCAMCPHEQWGSRITEAGKRGKACADNKRVVVVPLDDLYNEVFGGPMLLRVPAASLQDLAAYSNKMKGLGYPLFLIGTRIRFDLDAAYPKLIFSPFRVLTNDEALVVTDLREDPRTLHILNSVDDGAHDPGGEEGQVFEQPQAQAPAAPTAPTRPAGGPVRPAATQVVHQAAAPRVAPGAVQQAPQQVAAQPVQRTPAKPTGRPGGIAAAVARPEPARAVTRPAVRPSVAPPAHKPAIHEEEAEDLPETFQDELDARLNDLL